MLFNSICLLYTWPRNWSCKIVFINFSVDCFGHQASRLQLATPPVSEYQADECLPRCGPSTDVCQTSESVSESQGVEVTWEPGTKHLSGDSTGRSVLGSGPGPSTRQVREIGAGCFKFSVLRFLVLRDHNIFFIRLIKWKKVYAECLARVWHKNKYSVNSSYKCDLISYLIQS